MVVGFIQGSYEDYKALYIDGNGTPTPGTLYYLTDEAGHSYIFMNGKRYAATPVVYGEDVVPVEMYLTQSQYDTLEAAGLIDHSGATIYWIYRVVTGV